MQTDTDWDELRQSEQGDIVSFEGVVARETRHDPDDDQFTVLQTLSVEEPPSEIEGGDDPQSIRVVVGFKDNTVVKAGEHLNIHGEIHKDDVGAVYVHSETIEKGGFEFDSELPEDITL